jgi:hypothetical protein
MELVDSKQKRLNSFEIISIFLSNTGFYSMPVGGSGSKMSPEVAMPAIIAEFKQPNTEFVRLGNTIYILHKGKDGKGFFKAYNADTPRNFLENSRKFCVIAFRKFKMDYLVTEFQGQGIERLFYAISKNPPLPGMGYKVYKGQKTGTTRIVLKLGDRKKNGRSR